VFTVLKEMNTHAILCCLVKLLNHVAYEHVLIERVTEEVKRMLITVRYITHDSYAISVVPPFNRL